MSHVATLGLLLLGCCLVVAAPTSNTTETKTTTVTTTAKPQTTPEPTIKEPWEHDELQYQAPAPYGWPPVRQYCCPHPIQCQYHQHPMPLPEPSYFPPQYEPMPPRFYEQPPQVLAENPVSKNRARPHKNPRMQ